MTSQFSFSLYLGKKRQVSLNSKEDIVNILVLRYLCIFLKFKTLFQKDIPTDRF